MEKPADKALSNQPKEPEPNPRIQILQALQRNTFSDVFLQIVGLCVLGEVYRQHPEFNNPEDYVHVDFGSAQNDEVSKYSLRQQYVGRTNISWLLQEFDNIVRCTAEDMSRILLRRTHSANKEQVVGGTMRMHVSINHCEQDQIQFELMWAAMEVR